MVLLLIIIMTHKCVNRHYRVKGSLVPQLFNSGLRFLVSMIRNDASLKYSSHGHIRFSYRNRSSCPLIDISIFAIIYVLPVLHIRAKREPIRLAVEKIQCPIIHCGR